MIAEVYPIKRMPRRFGVFDYEVPAPMRLARGMFVRVPFRSGELVGVVGKTKDGGPRGIVLKPVSGVIAGGLSDTELGCLERVAFDTAQSVSAVLHATIPRPLKRTTAKTAPILSLPLTIPAREASSITLAVSQMAQRRAAFVCVPDLKRATAILATYLREHQDEPVMAILPNVRDARLVAERLQGYAPIVVTGEESAGDRFRAWNAWRAKNSGLLIGTRVASLWTHPALGAIFLLRSGHPNHKQEDRNPRFDARSVADIFYEALHARLFLLDVSPRADDVRRFGPNNMIGLEARPSTTMVDMTIERAGSPHPCLGQTTVMRMMDALEAGRRVICAYNHKGVARRIQCEDCAHRFPCQTCGGVLAVYEQLVRCHRCGNVEPIPLSCPSCHGNRLLSKGYGNRAVANAIQSVFPDKTVSCIEKGTELVASDGADVLVVTRHYLENVFSPFDPPDVGLVADLEADMPLFEPTYRAVEQALHDAEEWRGVAHACRAEILIQTNVPELFRGALSDPRRTLEEDLKTRAAYGQPPFRRRMTIDPRIDEPHERAHAVRAVLDRLRAEVPGTECVESDVLRLSVPEDEEQKILALFSTLDDRYIIDTRAIE